MKLRNIFLLLVPAALAVLSCGKNEEKKPGEDITPEITVVTTAFPSISDDGGTLDVVIKSNLPWTLSLSEGADWLSANPSSGEAGEEITITLTAQPNEGYDKRSATATVRCGNEESWASGEFTIIQKQKNALILSDDVIEIGYEGETIKIELRSTSGVEYSVSDNAKNWIVPVPPTSALLDYSFEFMILANDVKAEREGVITFTSEAGSETVTIKQEALPEPDPELSVTPTSVSGLSQEGEALKLSLSSNMPWTVSIADEVEWITVSPAKGEAGQDQEITVTVVANPDNDARSTDLTFSCTNANNDSKEVVVKVTQNGYNIPSAISIATADDLIKFADDYESGFYNKILDILTVTLTADIAFNETTSASFMGIGSGLNPFKASFDGANHAISGLVATAPLFPFIDSDATVKNLVIDSSCSFNFTHPNIAAVNFGAVAGYLKGTLDNVKVAADINLVAVADVKFGTNLGGLAGIVWEGSIKNCEYSGLISAPAGFTVLVPADDTSNRKLIIGGLAGCVDGSGSVDQSYFKGAISSEAIVEAEDRDNRFLKDTPYLIIGGVAGWLDGDASITATNTTADHETIQSAHTSETSVGQIVNKTTISFNSVVGGVVGENNSGTISDCTNATNIFNTIFKTGADISRYMKSGGIVGKNNKDGVVVGCVNEGTVQHRSNPKLQDLGGIAGYNAGSISSCTNNAAVNHMTSGQSTKAGRVVAIGGVIGENVAGATVSDIHNTANLEISSMEDGDKSDVRLGGVIGLNQAEIDGGASKNITNTGRVYFSPNMTQQFLGYEIGGVIGQSEASVRNVKNSGYVYFRWNSDANVASLVYLGGIIGKMKANGTIAGCVNEGGENNAGEVYPNVKAGAAGHNNIFAGGILGYSDKDVVISECSNSGYVHGGNTTKVNGKTFYIGGIAAYLKGSCQILDCTNTGQLNNTQSNNNFTIGSTPLTGGIVGYAEGTSENPIVIGGTTGCSVDATIASSRGWVAGVAGCAIYVNVSSCTVKQSINCAAHGIGGLVANAQYCNISSSSFEGEKVHANNTQVAAGQGGLIGNMVGTTVDACYSYASILTNNVSFTDVGAIVGVSGDGNTIKNCHYKATVTTTAGEVSSAIAGSGTFTDGGGNAADL